MDLGETFILVSSISRSELDARVRKALSYSWTHIWTFLVVCFVQAHFTWNKEFWVELSSNSPVSKSWSLNAHELSRGGGGKAGVPLEVSHHGFAEIHIPEIPFLCVSFVLYES